MLCKNCGHDITPSEKNCPFCGIPSGFPVGMNGDEKIPAVIDAEEILGDVISEAAAPVRAAAPKKPVTNEPAVYDQPDDNGTVAYVPTNEAPKTTDSPTVVFGAVTDQTVAPDDGFDDDYSYDNVVTPSEEPDYDDRYDRNYGEAYAPKRGGLTLTNTQIGLVSGVAAFIILLIIVILMFSKCGGGNDNDVSSDNLGSSSSNVATSSDISSLPSSSSGLSSEQSSSNQLSEPEEISSNTTGTTTSNTTSNPTSEPETPTTSTATSEPETPTTSEPETPTTSVPEAPTTSNATSNAPSETPTMSADPAA